MTEEKIHLLCKQYKITNYTINEDMSIDVNGNVDLHGENLNKIPLKFNKVSGWFDCGNNYLTSLKGSPVEVVRGFYCYTNKLTSLEGCPVKTHNFSCSNNNLSTLKNGPKLVDGIFYCYNNPIYNEFKNKFNENYNLYRKYSKRQKLLKSIIND